MAIEKNFSPEDDDFGDAGVPEEESVGEAPA